jgi:hypothetical protein
MLVAFGMIRIIIGVTFVSVPGAVGRVHFPISGSDRLFHGVTLL